MSKEKSAFPLASIERLMKENLPNNKIGKDNDAKRKTVKAEDVQSAFESIV
ncbi:MAG: hypothetical protein ACTSP7_00820 [Candidatus Heimdallarchaeota archaeon]